MNDQPHYRFPPASAYRLNRCLFALKSDDAFRSRFLKDAPACSAITACSALTTSMITPPLSISARPTFSRN